jgi:hypothetical protein
VSGAAFDLDLVIVAALVLLVAWYLTFSATRLDRLHARLEGAWSALDAQLVRRSSVALQLAASGRLDPATALLLADAAHEAREVDEEGREQAESDLTAALRAAFADAELVDDLRRDPVGGELVAELAASALRVQLARRFLNDVVRNARVVRRKRVVRYLRIAGHAPWPQTFEMSDTPPEALAGGSFTRDAYRRPT